jgi:Zn-dependent protease with chaperone function
MRPWRHPILLVLLALPLAGCFGTLHEVPTVDLAGIRSTADRMWALGPASYRIRVSEEVARERVNAAWERVNRVAIEVCQEMRVGDCTWRLDFNPSRSQWAGASSSGRIIVYRGLVEDAVVPEAIAHVIAHEMAHMMFGHAATMYRLATVGSYIGWIPGHMIDMMAVLVAKRKGFAASEVLGEYGAWIGNRLWARAREREADYFANLILFRAGLDLEKAQQFNINLARLDPLARSEAFDMHPLGSERVALGERAIADIRANEGRLPPRLRPP